MVDTQLSEFGVILLFITGALLFTGAVLAISRLIRPNRPNFEKMTTYECGEDGDGHVGQFDTKFYIIALIFILFEVEIIFLFPWAVVFGQKELITATNGLWGWFALVEVFVFIGILTLGLAYAWAKGYLDWVKAKPEVKNIKSPIPMKLYEEINRKYESENRNSKIVNLNSKIV